MLLKTGLVGTGAIANSFHIPAWQKVSDAKLVALCDTNPETIEQTATKTGIKGYLSLEEMLEKESLDILAVCTPHTLHAGHVLKGLQAGLHVIVEKPFVTSASDADRIISEAESRNLILMCAQHARFREESRIAKTMADQGRFGNIYYSRALSIKSRGVPVQNNSYTDIALSGGGPLMDTGVHVLDLAWWLMGCPEPDEYFSNVMTCLAHKEIASNQYGNWDKYNVEDFVSAQIRMKNRSLLSLETSYLLNSHRDVVEIEIFGDEGGLLWPDMIFTYEKQGKLIREKLDINEEVPASVAQIQHFLDCIIRGVDLIVPPKQSRDVISMIENIYH